MSTITSRIIISVSTLAVASAITWLIGAESSPLSEYFLYNVGFPNFWRFLNVIPALISMMVGGHSGNMAVFIIMFGVQWLALDWLISLLFHEIEK